MRQRGDLTSTRWPWLVGGAAVVGVLALGSLGWARLISWNHPLNVFYRALQLFEFTLDLPMDVEDIPLQLEVARYLAIVVVFAATIAAFFQLFRAELRTWKPSVPLAT